MVTTTRLAKPGRTLTEVKDHLHHWEGNRKDHRAELPWKQAPLANSSLACFGFWQITFSSRSCQPRARDSTHRTLFALFASGHRGSIILWLLFLDKVIEIAVNIDRGRSKHRSGTINRLPVIQVQRLGLVRKPRRNEKLHWIQRASAVSISSCDCLHLVEMSHQAMRATASPGSTTSYGQVIEYIQSEHPQKNASPSQ